VAIRKFPKKFRGYPLKVVYDEKGAVEMAEGVILHTTAKNEIVALEILDAAKKIPIKTLYKLELTPSGV